MAAAAENFYIATGDVGGLIIPAAIIYSTERSQRWMVETSSSEFFHQERNQRKSGPLTQLGVFQIVNAFLHIFLGLYLAITVNNLHLIAMKSWYPFWGAIFFICSGALLITMERESKMKLTWTIAVSITDCLCALCGIIFLIKDLFWESPFDYPIWRPYPTHTVNLQRFELGLLILSSFELFTFIYAMILLCRTQLSSEVMDNSSMGMLPQEHTFYPTAPPPTYEEVVFDDQSKKADP
ncbi:membrane-spanning 4-domains subfamily A member 10 isoform X2 [Macrotis lagotis]|uniref:membrane-spanning 4-domains subfamily A member 10 isoform X2 n=1 Tax=Macrotis lagotis TaxID=92651 RepID=UPI003D68F711